MSSENKVCKTCGEAKPPADFYARRKVCKCCVTQQVRANRNANIEHYRAFDRSRANNPDRVAKRKAYQKTEAFRVSHDKAVIRYKEKHASKRSAQVTLGNALRDGKIQRLPCFVCGSANSEAHHSDYSAPLAVTWLCDKHHKETHMLARRLMRQAA